MTNPLADEPSFAHEPSLARTLRQAGYVTGMAGKWRQMSDTPGDWGFDEWLTDPTAGGWYWETNYTKNGELITTTNEVYVPDVCMDFTRDFFQRHRDEPFYFYFPTHLIHGPILRTPDSATNTVDFIEDNVLYLDKQVGQMVAELDRLGLREKTLIVFTGDNGTVITGIAASLSMAASEYLSTRSEKTGKHPVRAAIYTGIAYIITVALLVLPYLLMPENFYADLAIALTTAVIIIAVFNYYISVAKGESFKARFLEMAGLSFGVATFSFIIGYFIRQWLGIEI